MPDASSFGKDHMEKDHMEKLLSVKQVAEILGVSEGWVRDHATRKRPRLPVIKLGKYLRFSEPEIDNWVRKMSGREPTC